MYIRLLLSICLLKVTIPVIRADDYEWGDCPRVDPVPNFDLNKFSGLWYVAEKFDVSTPCWTYYFISQNNTRKVIQSRNEIVDGKNPEKTPGTVGTLEIVNPMEPGFMKVQFSDNIIGKANYIVFFTDYENYGAIFRCQKFLFGHRRSATILSRKPYIPASFLNRARAKLLSFRIDISPFKTIEQSNCKYTQSVSGESYFNLTKTDMFSDFSSQLDQV